MPKRKVECVLADTLEDNAHLLADTVYNNYYVQAKFLHDVRGAWDALKDTVRNDRTMRCRHREAMALHNVVGQDAIYVVSRCATLPTDHQSSIMKIFYESRLF